MSRCFPITHRLPMLLQRFLAALARGWPWLGRVLNRFAVNSVVKKAPYRPHPWSTVSDYVSWTSLTDQRWSARHLPATPIPNLPAVDQVMKLFEQPSDQRRLSKKSTCLFPAFAQYLTDGFIRTRMPNKSTGEPESLRRQNTSNHQIDLCTLYGRIEAQTTLLRLRSNKIGERGRLKSQKIKDEEFSPFLFINEGTSLDPQFLDPQQNQVLDPPLGLDHATPPMRATLFATGGDRVNAAPQIAMMNTLFLREHNRIAGLIEADRKDWDDERVFQTTRNIIIVLFIKMVVEEYINHISPSPIRFFADASVAWDAPWNRPNWITTEFSLLYRWHSLIPGSLQWNGKAYPAEVTLLNNAPLLEGGLLQAFLDMSSQAAGELGAFNTASALLEFERRAIDQGRLCQVAPYVQYRRYVGLPVPHRFEEVSSNPKVVEYLKKTYSGVEQIEFYPGLFAEDPVENSPLPELMLTMVAIDAFSQALTNPLLSKRVVDGGNYSRNFTELGRDLITKTNSLRDILARNSSLQPTDAHHVGMTQKGWRPS
jgi:prostaglandin-endoperoxide synthase 2